MMPPGPASAGPRINSASDGWEVWVKRGFQSLHTGSPPWPTGVGLSLPIKGREETRSSPWPA